MPRDDALSTKRDMRECGWICACTLALGQCLAVLFYGLYLTVKLTSLPRHMGTEGLMLLAFSSFGFIAPTGGCLICATIWYRVRRDMEWALVCCVGGGAMGVVLGFMGICVFCVAPITLENAQHRIDAAIRAEFENYNRDVNAQNDQSNQFDETQQNWACCGVAGPGDYPYYHGIDPPPSCCGKPPCRNREGLFNKGCRFVMTDVFFVAKVIYGILGILTGGVVILWFFITIKLIDYKHILTREPEVNTLDADEDDEHEIDVEHLKMD